MDKILHRNECSFRFILGRLPLYIDQNGATNCSFSATRGIYFTLNQKLTKN